MDTINPATAPALAAPPLRCAKFAIGQVVKHPRFGDGVIIAAEGSGSDARVQVKFAEAGSKWLMLAVAKLTPAS